MSADGDLIELVANIVALANATNDERILRIMDFAIKELGDDVLPTVLLRYHALLKQEDEMNRGGAHTRSRL